VDVGVVVALPRTEPERDDTPDCYGALSWLDDDEVMSMDPRFAPLNALIAFCSTTRTSWPRPMYDCGYQLAALEFPAKAGNGRVVVDVVAWAPNHTRLALGEAKAGANVDEAQAKRYSDVNPSTLVQTLNVTVTKADPPRAQIVYAVQAQHKDRVLLGLSKAGVTYPVLSISATDVRRVGGEFDDPALVAAFAAPISVLSPPPGIITIDAESSDAEFDAMLNSSLVALASRQGESMTVRALTEDAIRHLFLYPTGYQQRLVKKMESAARRAAAAAPETFSYTPPSAARSVGTVHVLDNPENADPRGRTQRYQALAARFASPTTKRKPRVDEAQLSFFPGGPDLESELAEVEGDDEYGPEGDSGS
jgi:hypothetical protein